MSIHIERTISTGSAVDLKETVWKIKDEFIREGAQVDTTPSSNGYFISITKGNALHSILGLKKALTLSIYSDEDNVHLKVNSGIFGLCIIPIIIAIVFLFLIPLISIIFIILIIVGIAGQSQLNTRVFSFTENELKKQHTFCEQNSKETKGTFCSACGKKIENGEQFCPYCGSKQ